MGRSRVFSSALPALVVASVALAACSSQHNGTPGALSVSPASAKVLTCSTLQLKATGGAGNGMWTVAPAGLIDRKSGLFTAPLTAPADPASTITYSESAGTVAATVQLATAFLGPIATLPTSDNPDSAGTHSPLEHTFTATGSRVYTAIQRAASNGAFLEVDLFVSNDSGKTFSPGAVYHTGNLEANCVIAAADAANPDVVYLTYQAGHGDSTSNTGSTVRLAVSEDGGKTFPTEYIVADNAGSLAGFICPDVISPSADHVIVSGIATDSTNTSTSSWAATFASGNRGKAIGPVGMEGVAAPANPAAPTALYAASDTNSSTAKVGCEFAANGGGQGPRVASNGAGITCLTYTGTSGACNGYFVQCSSDSGATWTSPQSIATPTTNSVLSSAVSKSGNVALVWLASVAGHTEVMLAISKDGGKNFGTPIQYPSTARNALVAGSYTYAPMVTWETDDVLWLTQTLNGADSPVLMADKTCDFGVSWSGAVNAGPYKSTTLLSTANGMVATGWGKGTTNVVTVPLEQLSP